MRHALRFIFRGALVELERFDPSLTVLEWLRETQRATGTKEGCNEGDCGACTVVLVRAERGKLHYSPANACILLLGQLDGAELLTIEDVGTPHNLHPVQEAMLRHHGSQCGFCTPGIVMSLFAAYHEAARPATRHEIETCLQGNLCRCTGYRPIIDAALEVMGAPPEDAFSESTTERLARLNALHDDEDAFMGDEASFFAAPATLDGLAHLTARFPDARFVAGATDFSLHITKKLQHFSRIIGLGRISALRHIDDAPDALHLGAMVTHEAATPYLAALDPDLGVLMQRFAAKQVRSTGTIGGNIANGSPIGDLAPALIALGATLHLQRGSTRRSLPLEAFFLAYGKQDRAPDELVTGLTIPKLHDGQHFRAFKLSKRFDEDISAVMAAFFVQIVDGTIESMRLAFGGMAGIPKRASATEAAFLGVSLNDPHAWALAMQHLETDFTPLSDMRASAAYRARAARALLGKALLEIAGTRAQTRLLPREEAAHAG